MGKMILIRVLQFPLVLGVIYLITFLLVWVAPGSPFEQSQRKMDPAALEALKVRFHAESTASFLGYYPMRILLHGDFGPSLQYKEWSVNDIMRSALPISVALGMFALTIAVIAGVAIGTMAAVRRGGATDWFGMTLTLVGISLPSFVAAAVLLIVFTNKLKWFPVG
ncbi:MAG TPA: ABC transporter permease, partial [Tepidisphaeraceae bacterium]|nr:ABC transporter permease [Tepidisphaeraceae bacterium]